MGMLLFATHEGLRCKEHLKTWSVKQSQGMASQMQRFCQYLSWHPGCTFVMMRVRSYCQMAQLQVTKTSLVSLAMFFESFQPCKEVDPNSSRNFPTCGCWPKLRSWSWKKVDGPHSKFIGYQSTSPKHRWSKLRMTHHHPRPRWTVSTHPSPCLSSTSPLKHHYIIV